MICHVGSSIVTNVPLVVDFDNVRIYMCAGGGILEISVPSPQFCYEP